MSISLLIIADPTARFLTFLPSLPGDVDAFVSENPEELKTKAPLADAILYAHTDGALLLTILPLAKRARWIHSLWTGVDGILGPSMIEHPAPLTNGRGVFRWPLADWIVAAMLCFAFDFRRVIRQQEQGLWKPFVGTTLDGRTLGIVGYGSIGSAAATRARAFGMNIAAFRRTRELFGADPSVDRNFGPENLKDLMAASDYVLAATPLTAETRGLIGEAEIAAMKPTAVIINVGRGPVINEQALIRALEAGRIRGAALDVFDVEPLPADHPFWRMSNVLLSPHTADRVEGFLGPAFDCFFGNLNRFKKSETLMNVVDKIAGY